MTMRRAQLSELTQILAMAAHEEWNPGHDDGAAFFAADPEGFFVTEIDGVIRACISVVNHDDDYAFLGLYICDPNYRGKGIGKALWDYAITHADTRHIGLDGVLAQQANYAKSGFIPIVDTCRFEGQIEAAPDPSIRLATSDDLPKIIELDHQANGMRRANMMATWTAPDNPYRKTVIFDDHSGFATIRTGLTGVKIGPIIANSVAEAMSLIKAALHELPSETVFIDVHGDKTAMMASLIHHGFEQGFVVARMYKGVPPIHGDTLLAVASMELG